MERLQGILSSIAKIIGSPHVGKAVENLPLALSTQGNEPCSTDRCDRNLIVGRSAGSNLSGVNVNARFRTHPMSASTNLRVFSRMQLRWRQVLAFTGSLIEPTPELLAMR
jgi:hypothetical protein